ncbi:MAG: hypothetical protein C0448_13940 [Sphingobacteriaceae bacterium]|nr:hypothetical protein [Sphingobacteriaceae bacterium]
MDTNSKNLPENVIKEEELKKVYEEAITQENKKTNFYVAGISLFWIAGITSIILFFYYWYTGLLFSNNTKNCIEGIFLLGGFIASIAGICFVIDNLTLQRRSLIKQSIDIAHQRIEIKQNIQEAKDANKQYEAQTKIMSVQQAESTFFNLLNNQKTLVNNYSYNGILGLEALNMNINNFKSNLSRYKESLSQQQFKDIDWTFYHPLKLYEDSDSFKTFADYCVHIISFIQEKLDDNEFYHSTYYYNMSNSEKYIIGFLIVNDIIVFNDLTPLYKFYYQENTAYIKEYDGYFPTCFVDKPNNVELKVNISNAIKSKMTLKRATTYKFNTYDDGVKLKSYSLRLKYSFRTDENASYQPAIESDILYFDAKNNTFDLLQLFESFIIPKYEALIKKNIFGLQIKSQWLVLQTEYQNDSYEIFLPNLQFTFLYKDMLDRSFLTFHNN